VEKFLRKYVSGNEELPLASLLSKVGCELRSTDDKKDKIAFLAAMKNELKEMKNPSPAQLQLRQAWIHH
jgi:predicted metalloprotease with PDZ domain